MKKILFLIILLMSVNIFAQIPTLKLNETTNMTRSTYDSVFPIIEMQNPANVSLSNVNSSDYWDNLDTPADINTADLTDDNTYVRITGDTMLGNLLFGSAHRKISSSGPHNLNITTDSGVFGTGDVYIKTGNANVGANSGDINITTGNSDGRSGSVNIGTGTTGTIKGIVRFIDNVFSNFNITASWFNGNVKANSIILNETIGACDLTINHSFCANGSGTYIIGWKNNF